MVLCCAESKRLRYFWEGVRDKLLRCYQPVRCLRHERAVMKGDHGKLAVPIGRDPGPNYAIGAETCSCTITHLPSFFSQITVQRKFPISTFPAFVVISSFTVAVPHTRSPCWCMAASSLTVNFAL